MAARALVTGAAGFAGQWLVRGLLDAGWEVVGTLRRPADRWILSDDERSAVRWIQGDVRDAEHLRAALDAARPDAVAHLAAVTFVPAAGADPGATFETNAVAAVRLLHEIGQRRAAGILDPAVLVVGSSEQYGRQSPEELPLREDGACRPISVYAASKCAQETAGGQAFRAAGVRTVMTRSFSHSGAGQPARFLLPALVGRALALHAGAGAGRPALPIGNLDTVRDFLHVTDVVRAYITLLERGVPGEVYNVCSGRGRTVAELVARVLARTGVDAAPTPDPALMRPVETPTLIGDPTKLQQTTGWAPRHDCDDIIDDLIHAATH